MLAPWLALTVKVEPAKGSGVSPLNDRVPGPRSLEAISLTGFCQSSAIFRPPTTSSSVSHNDSVPFSVADQFFQSVSFIDISPPRPDRANKSYPDHKILVWKTSEARPS